MPDNREYAVFSACCSICGNPVSFVLEDQATTPKPSFGPMSGGYSVKFCVSVNPCQICYGKATKPIELIREALRGIKE